MLSSLLLISKYLSQEQRVQAVEDLSKDLGSNTESVTALCDLLKELDQNAIRGVYPVIQKFVFSIIDGKCSESDYGHILTLAEELPQLYDDILDRCHCHLSAYIHESLPKFLISFRNDILPEYLADLISSSKANFQLTDESIVTLFEFLNYFFIHAKLKDQKTSSLDRIISFFIGHNEENVSNLAMQCLRWEIDSIVIQNQSSKFIWDVIFNLEKSQVKLHMDHAFIVWLRYLTNDNQKLVEDSIYQHEIIQLQHYWQVLQHGLVSDAHEHRKFCLSILQLSLKLIAVPVKNEIFSWDPSKKDEYLREWSRFSTLFEILGIDTSLHQAQGGINDLIGLILPDSLIHPSWGFGLLSTGFKAGMDSVRKFSLNILLSIPSQNLYLLKHSLPFYEQTYLPYAMMASHFAVLQSDDTNGNHCEHADRLASFIQSIISNLKTDEEFQAVVYSTLKVLVSLKDAFDPARIYVTYGILSGLKKRRVLQFGKHDELLLKLIEVSSEGPVLETTVQTLNLRLFLNFQLSDLNVFLDLLIKFTKFNGYAVLNENLDLVVEYFQENQITQTKITSIIEGESVSADVKIVLMLISNKMTNSINLENQSNVLLAKLLQTNISLDSNENIPRCITELATGEKSEEAYEEFSKVDFLNYKQILPTNIKLIELWATINQDVQSDDHHRLKAAADKFKVFNNLFEAYQLSDIENHEIFTINSLLKFNREILLNNSSEPARLIKNFYRVKDALYGQFFRFLSILTSKIGCESTEIDDILSLLIVSSTNYETNFYTVLLLNTIVKQENLSSELVPRLVETLSEIWSNLCSSRLQLSQKNLHVLMIDTFIDPFILSHSTHDEFVASHLLNFSKSIIELSYGRRCFLPTLTKNLSNFQIKDHQNFEKLIWLPEVLVESFMSYQLRSNIFRLENIIASLYDKQISSTAGSNIYTKYYGAEEISGRINAIVLINSIQSSEFALLIFQFIRSKEEEYHLFQVIKQNDGFQEWRRIQLLTVILSIIQKIDSSLIIDDFMALLGTEPSPLVRVYLEWITARILLREPKYIDIMLEKFKVGMDSNSVKPTLITAYERILYLSIQHLTTSKEAEYLTKFLSVLFPGATSNKATTRHFSLSLNCSIYPEIMKKKLPINPDIIQMSENLYKSAVSSDAFGSYRSGDALLWDILGDFTLVGMTGSVLLRVSDRSDIDFIRKEDYNKHLSQAQIDNLQNPVGEDLKELWIRVCKNNKIAEDLNSNNKIGSTNEKGQQATLQTKSGAWSTVMDVDETARGGEIVRSDLIVVSSLVDKPPNLGGICRLCDVLGAGLLTLNDIRVKNHPQFKNVAVTADYWMPMIEVKENGIIEFLREKKKEGYTLIGLEQTTNSVELNSNLQFPKKSLILIGKEKEGVPGDLLAELDMCVEIKQVGVIRSMNIQTATAIIVHAYSTQHC
ncbi:hypothetical protein HYPBUDRAFT_132917 [Hyphopichia burtonii NRRL Y-1933]|uniref:tRNA/rRNA methyltransferase SpoU type domain-containing protein n=1 Tax=Hyphopichia burtonii NRRL Y-1933 TaxID=984485 RepID=A0A1E4RS31_9ASCO|nr:hypothetical protein HYPBUDRAFT_132917 [Hyphopichia burtonii NRRL Y-1933]ODV70073.1 hypothetical protein HYPBUDRAFT_132917 [Hyphopichia burtonii NRRL Y-1933]